MGHFVYHLTARRLTLQSNVSPAGPTKSYDACRARNKIGPLLLLRPAMEAGEQCPFIYDYGISFLGWGSLADDPGREAALDHAAGAAVSLGIDSKSIQFTPQRWPSRSSKLRPYMKSYSSRGEGSITPPALPARLTTSSTSARLSADMQIKTWLVVLASAICLVVNCRYFSWVNSITWMVSENTMQDAVSSQNCALLTAPIA